MMNPDYTSDLRIVERFIFEHNIYLLTMFEKKVDSFTATPSSTIDSRRQHKEANLHSGTIIDCDNSIQDPVKNLARDLTKPIWNCVTKVDPKIIYAKESAREPIEIINSMSKILHAFFSRLKNEHEDESNLKLNLLSFEFDNYVEGRDQEMENLPTYHTNLKRITADFLSILLQSVEKEEQSLEDMQMSENPIEEFELSELKATLAAGKEILNFYIQRNDENFNNELDVFNKIVVNSLFDVINCKIGSLVLCLQPKLMYLPLLVHPLLISVHNLIKCQLNDLLRREEMKANRNGQNLMREMETEKEVQEGSFAFGDFNKTENLSRVVFLNFDGYESEFNVDIAKYLSKSLMYVSFPKESNCKYESKEEEETKRAENFRSERLLRKYFYGGLSSQEKIKLLEYFKPSEKDLKRNLYTFPIHSRSLSSSYGLPQLYSTHDTAFISFIMSEIMYSQILEFNPSLIVISYSQKINISNDYFVELMKELTVLGNYKIVFYANLAKNYLFEEYYSDELEGLYFYNREKENFEKHESHMKIFNDELTLNPFTSTSSSQSFNCDMLEKIAIMIKISSGTYNLSRNNEIDTSMHSYIEKYKNYKAMTYSGPLIKKLSEEYTNLNKLKMRLNDYVTVSRVLDSYFLNRNDTFGKLFPKVISRYHNALFIEVEKILGIAGDKRNIGMRNENMATELSQEEEKRRSMVDAEITKLKEMIEKKFSQAEKKESWGGFKFQRYLELSTEKLEYRFFAHIPKYEKSQKSLKKQAENLICLEFYIVIDKEKIQLEFSPSTTKIYYSQFRKHPESLIYITNHLLKTASPSYTHLYGIIGEEFDTKVSPKVQVYSFDFKGGPELTNYENYTEFNYYESELYVFMFWPKIYDSRKELLSKFCGVGYMPASTGLFFRAYRNQPGDFNLIYNSVNDQIIPRHGCQCYEVSGTNSIYIFGGFYGDEKNYLLFQTDVTRLEYQRADGMKQDPVIKLRNISKEFYFDYAELEANREIKVISKLKNDMIRPKIEYEFLEHPNPNPESSEKTIFLIGGVGQNFLRPYSMITHMSHRVTFNSVNGDIISIKRIHMNNIIPVNAHNPIRLRSPMESKILTYAENRSINFGIGESGMHGYTVYHNDVRYNVAEERFEYESEYEFTDLESKNYRDELSFLKKSIIANVSKIGMEAKSSRGKQLNTNFISVLLENESKYILELQLQLSLDVKSLYPNLPNTARLTGTSILSIDVNGTFIYALIKHPIYTLDQCILGYYDLNDLSVKLKENKPMEVQLKQLHKFDEDVSNNIVIAANAATVLVVHGQKFVAGVEVMEFLLRRNRRNNMKIANICGNEAFDSSSTSHSMRSNYNNEEIDFVGNQRSLTGGLSASIFINQNNGVFLCFSFKSVERGKDYDEVYVVLEKLDVNNEKYAWQKLLTRKYQFKVQIEHNLETKKRDYLKLLEIIEQRRESSNPLKCTYEIIALYRDQCLHGKIEFESSNSLVIFSAFGKSGSEYFKELSVNTKKQHSIMLEKHEEMYSELIRNEENLVNRME